jgi:tetratricopeptide (TPR) repeat protein
MKKFVLIASLTTIYTAFLFKITTLYFADILSTRAAAMLKQMNTEKALAQINKAIELNPNESAYYRIRAKAYLLETIQSKTPRDSKAKALINLKKAVQLNPQNLATIRNSMGLYYYLAIKDLGKPASIDNINEGFVETTMEFLKAAKQNYPTDAGVLVSVAKYEKLLGLSNDYRATIAMIQSLRPDLLEWHKDLK